MDQGRIKIVIPAYNEASAIGDVLDKLLTQFSSNDIILVNDGSVDDTGLIAKKSEVKVLRHAINRGQGAALLTGINYALKQDADIIVTFDADGQFDAAEIKDLARQISSEGYDIVLGSRFLNNNSNIPPSRKLILKLGILFTHLTTGLRVTDTHNGFRALSRKAAEIIRIKQDRMAHSSEILHEIKRLNLKWKEVPVTVRYSAYSRAKGQKWYGAFKIVWDLVINKLVGD